VYFYSGLAFLVALFIGFLIFSSDKSTQQEAVKERIIEENIKRSQENRDIKIVYKEEEKSSEKAKEPIEEENKKETPTKSKEIIELEKETKDYVTVSSNAVDDINIEIISNEEFIKDDSMFPQIPTLVSIEIDGDKRAVAVPTELLMQNSSVAIRVLDANGDTVTIKKVEKNSQKDGGDAFAIPQIPSL
jgi:hypothetical protein